MTVTHSITMDLVKPLVRPLVTAVQGEGCSRVLRITLLAGGTPFAVPKSAGAVVRYRKRDGTGGIYDTLPDGSRAWWAEENVLSVTLAPQVLTCDGPVDLQVELRQDSAVLSTFSVCVLVDADPSRGAQPSQDYLSWMDATVEALAAYLAENPLPGGSAVAVENEGQLQQLLAGGTPVYVNKEIGLTGPIIIDRNYTWLEFGPQGSLNIQGKGFPAIILTASSEGKKPAWVRIENPRIYGSWSGEDASANGSVGIQIQALGWHNEINHAEIQSCEYGIQTSGALFDYDCGQQNSFYELYITNCRYGIDDRAGGLQNVRFTGGRIENNKEWGLVSASCNLCFNGTMIQGNDLGEVKLVNIYAGVYERIVKSGGIFTNCYFEHAVRYDEDGEQLAECVFRLGDENQGEGWFGQLSLVGCKIGHFSNPVIRSYGRGAVLDGYDEQNLQRIQLIGCTCNGKQLFYLPNMDNGCRLLMLGVTQGQEQRLHTDVGENVVMQYLNNQYSRLGMTQATAISGVNAPLEYAHMRQLYLEPYGYEIDENGYPLQNEDGSYTPKASYGNWVEATASPLPPWLEEGAGVNNGSLHYASKYTSGYISPGWFVRTGVRDTVTDDEGNTVKQDSCEKWSTLVTASARGVQDRVHGKTVLLEPVGSEYGSWLAMTHAKAKPWDCAEAGIMKGSLHYCTADGKWYQRTALRSNGVDSADKWSVLVKLSDIGGAEQTSGEGELTGILLASSTSGSEKKFRITVDDSGTLSAVEYTG